MDLSPIRKIVQDSKMLLRYAVKMAYTKRTEKTKFWRAPEFDNMELLKATYITHAFSKHIHDEFAIGVIDIGAESFYYRSDIHVASEGCVVVINPGEIHTGQAASPIGWTYRMMYPSVDLMRQMAAEMLGHETRMPYFGSPLICDPHVAGLIRQLHTALETSTAKMERESLVRMAFGQLVLRHAVNKPSLTDAGVENAAVNKARMYMDNCYAENPSLEQVAALVGFSPFHFLRVFQQQVGIPPHMYLTHVRVKQAKAFLEAGVPIAETALAVGFADQSHLTRCFKRVMGITPGQYVSGL